MRVVVFRIGELGDTIIALPALRAVRDHFSQAHIALLGNVHSNSNHIRPPQILPPGLIDEWISYPSDQPRRTVAHSINLLFRLRRGRFDAVVYLAPRNRAPIDVRRDLFFFKLAGINLILGAKGFEPLPVRTNSGLPIVEHETDHLLRRLALSGIKIPDPNLVKSDLELSADDRALAHEWCSKNAAGFESSVLVGFGSGSKWASKVWPEARVVELGHKLICEREIFPVVFGGAEDRALASRLIQTWGRGANAAGVLSPRQAAAALENCAMFIGNDTGTMHLAAAVGTPCVVTMSAQDWPGRWNPYGNRHIVLRREVPCSGCMLKSCDTEGLRCLVEIGVDEVLSAALKILSHEPRKPSCPQNNFNHVENYSNLDV